MTEFRRPDWPLYTVWADDGSSKIHGLSMEELQLLHAAIGHAIETQATHHPAGQPKSFVEAKRGGTDE